ncbi:ABC transporter substrate-binding protein [Nocardioides sp. YIM 152315]|uniref:ABC transporter substrate-binding protein n=1 Tax=Nocardioides sp. YIM 152315 TaxID=3031760 RepID=UPI0023DCCFC6|nr:ABC transporter substrate-binding protein [Nocardioides sp. YIM 152315]MDF1604675.1 ABC transporter substrate-binding protein [Nocardioides sp. YIM 152315]
MMRRRAGGVGLAAATAICLAATMAGCSSSADGDPNDSPEITSISFSEGYINGGEEAEGDPVDGGTLTISDYSEARSLDPSATVGHGSAGGNALAAVYDLLVRYNTDSGEFEPWLADSIESNDDHTVWTLGLKDDVTFSDGTPVDAASVLGSIGYYMKNGGSDAGMLSTFLTGMEPVDGSTVKFTLNQPWTTFPYMLARGAGMIMAPAAYSGAEFKPIGAGPFELENYAPAEELVLTRRDDYWNGTPHLEKVRFTWIDSDDAREDVLDSGQADLVSVRSAGPVNALAAESPGYVSMSNLGEIVSINDREGRPGADPRVRKAIALAIDVEAYYQRTADGKGLPLKKIYGESSQWSDADVAPIADDVEEAKSLVEEAKADGFDGKLQYVGNSSASGRTQALALQAMLETVGFEVETKLLRSVADQIERLYVTHDYDLARSGASSTEMSPFEGLFAALSSKSYINTSGYASPKMDKLLDQLQAADTDESRAAALAEIETLFVEDVPVAPLGTTAAVYAWQDDVHGVSVSADELLMLGGAWKDGE